MATMIIPADDPAYVPVGANELMLLGEYGRTVTVECAACQCGWRLKLITDDVLTDERCDELLNAHLRDNGWGVGGEDTCPSCTHLTEGRPPMDDAHKIELYEWRLEEIRQYFAAWDAEELPAHRALEGINNTLSADPF